MTFAVVGWQWSLAVPPWTSLSGQASSCGMSAQCGVQAEGSCGPRVAPLKAVAELERLRGILRDCLRPGLPASTASPGQEAQGQRARDSDPCWWEELQGLLGKAMPTRGGGQQ